MSDPGSDSRAAQAEERFRIVLQQKYLDWGLSSADPLYAHYVRAETEATYQEGRRIVRELRTEAGERLSGMRILDLGCGFCGSFIALSEVRAFVIGLDLSRSHLDIGRQRVRLHGHREFFVNGDAFYLPFASNGFDSVICTSVLEHVRPTDRRRLIAECARVLRPGGILYLAFPSLFGLRNVISDPHYRMFGVSLMPRTWADRYIRWRIGRPYDAEVFPIPYQIRVIARTNEVVLFNLTTSERVLLDRLAHPSEIRRSILRIFVTVAHSCGFGSVLRWVVRARSTLGSHTVLMGRKRVNPQPIVNN